MWKHAPNFFFYLYNLSLAFFLCWTLDFETCMTVFTLLCFQAFLDAWKAACTYNGKSWFVVPDGEFLLGEIEFEGPCTNKGSPTVEIRGTVKAVKDPSKFSDKSWITFRHVEGLNISGGGTLDGQGELAWDKNSDCHACKMLAVVSLCTRIKNCSGIWILAPSDCYKQDTIRC